MPEAVIIDCLRTAVGRAPRGALRNTRPDDLAAIVIRALLKRYPQATAVEDVILGCAMPEGESGNNMARQALLRAGLPDSVPGMTINRFCSSGLQSIALAADRIRAGGSDILIAGGAESMSLIPFGGNKPAPNPWFVDHWPEVYMSMGLTAERLQKNMASRAKMPTSSRSAATKTPFAPSRRAGSTRKSCRSKWSRSLPATPPKMFSGKMRGRGPTPAPKRWPS